MDWRKAADALIRHGITLDRLAALTPSQLVATLFDEPAVAVDPVEHMTGINRRRAAKGLRPAWNRDLLDAFKRA